MEKEWSAMTKEEKRDKRMKDYIEGTDIKFRDAKAEKLYHERVNRMVKVARCEKPDRVPVSIPAGHYPAYYAGYNFKTVMYDADKLKASWRKFMNDFYEDMDSFMGPAFVFSGRVMDICDFKNYSWPGHGLGDNVNTHQYVEAQYMKESEYGQFMKDPSDFAFRVLTPRTMGAAEGLKYFPPLTSFMATPLVMVYPFARKEIRESFQKLINAGEAMEQWQQELAESSKESMEAGFPAGRGGMGIAPFDVIGDFLRGTQGVAIDMFRRPQQLLECIDMVYDIIVPRAIQQINEIGGWSMGFPLHRGDDAFMSRAQFEKFYWPSLKKYIDALINEGIEVSLFAEGKYNERLDYIGDFPKGWVSWAFDQTDMANAKKAIGDKCHISGNVPSSVIITGTPEQVKDNCKRLLETCAPGGGYTLAGGAAATDVKNPRNLKVFMEAAIEYGTY
ncbi:MAG: uroporphyrinogen decarboxylase family protein [Dehalococcoidales bacterium]|nr:uroporphyrinogen decarboxylase family protein [Dehalococcoidales bacterium]